LLPPPLDDATALMRYAAATPPRGLRAGGYKSAF